MFLRLPCETESLAPPPSPWLLVGGESVLEPPLGRC
jgi:hypothetical protein